MEVVGLATALVPLAWQIADGTRKLRDAYKLTGALPSKLDRLTENLSLLQHIAQLLSRCNLPLAFLRGIIESSLDGMAKELNRVHKAAVSPKKLSFLSFWQQLVISSGLAIFSTQQTLPEHPELSNTTMGMLATPPRRL